MIAQWSDGRFVKNKLAFDDEANDSPNPNCLKHGPKIFLK